MLEKQTNNLKRRIAVWIIKWMLSGGFQTHRGVYKLKKKLSLKNLDLNQYASREVETEYLEITYIKNALLYLPDIIDILFPDFDEAKITEEEAIFLLHIKDAILMGIRGGTKNVNEFTDVHLPHRSVNPEHIIRAIDKLGNMGAMIVNADSYYRDLFMNTLLTLWQVYQNFSLNYDEEYIKKYGMTWFQKLKIGRVEYNIRVMQELYYREHGERIKVINTNGKYTILKEVRKDDKHHPTLNLD